jgi:type I restriction enzyme, S subunit
MSRIDDLIQQHCPNGVEYRALGDVLSYEQPTKYLVSSTEYSRDYATPVLTAGQTFVLGYTDETDGVYRASPTNPVIIFDDFTTAFKWVDFPFKAKSSAMKMLVLRSEAPTTLRFIWYAMQLIRYSPQDHARQWISTYSQFTVPLPPLEVQHEIVRVLDLFQSLEAELEAELEARRRQYAHYRDSLLDFTNSRERERVRWVILGDVVRNLDSQRRPVTSSARQAGTYPYFGANGVQDYVHDYLFDGTFLLMGEDGSVMDQNGSPILNWATGKIWVNNHAHVLVSGNDDVRLRYLYHYLRTVNISQFVTGRTQPKLNQGNMNRIPIALPDIAAQDRIVRLLDEFDALVSDLSVGLPAELAARRRQYEYYRDRLLSFQEAA